MRNTALGSLADIVGRCQRLVVLTGAGCSTGSGIPDYRGADGSWKQKPPMTFGQFVRSASARRRYWARSVAGWPRVADAEPNAAHRALARLEDAGHVRHLITQNVDRLHQKAGSKRVIDLHGRLDVVVCLGCRRTLPRASFQRQLLERNPGWESAAAVHSPYADGDAKVAGADCEGFDVPPCMACSGIFKPDVVFFGENVPRARLNEAFAHLDAADGLLVVGSSLMIWSGYRFVRTALAGGRPVAAVNLGRTRADDHLSVKLQARCEDVLPRLAELLEASGSVGGKRDHLVEPVGPRRQKHQPIEA